MADEQAPVAEEPTPAGQEPEAPEIDIEAMRKELAEARREAAKYRTSLRKFEQEQKDKATESMTAEERYKTELGTLQQRLAAAEQTAHDRLVRSAVVSAAAKAGFVDPDDAFALVDHGALDISEDGSVTGVDDAIRAIAKAKPYLVRPKATSSTAAPAGGPQAPSDAQLRAELFGGNQGGAFWRGAGVTTPQEKD